MLRYFRANLDPGTLFFEIIFPLFFIFIQGFAFSGIVPPFEVAPGVVISYPLFLAPGAITFTVVNRGTTAGQQLWFDRKSGMFEQILMGPFTKAQYILSIIISTILIGLSGATIVFVLAFARTFRFDCICGRLSSIWRGPDTGLTFLRQHGDCALS